MLTMVKTCPDCNSPFTIIQELPDEVAEIRPSSCSGCGRSWTAVILVYRDHRDVKLFPLPRLSGSQPRG